MTHKVSSEWQSDMHFVTDTEGGNVVLDADEAVGGKGLGLRPKPLMLVALAGCTAMDVASLLKKMRAEVKDFKVDVEGELTEEHPKYYHKVVVHYYFGDETYKKDKIEKAVDLSVNRYCGVFEMFRQFSKIEYKIHYK
ncbi:MAG: OsmC family protein [Putridiphycobacter sp.]